MSKVDSCRNICPEGDRLPVAYKQEYASAISTPLHLGPCPLPVSVLLVVRLFALLQKPCVFPDRQLHSQPVTSFHTHPTNATRVTLDYSSIQTNPLLLTAMLPSLERFSERWGNHEDQIFVSDWAKDDGL